MNEGVNVDEPPHFHTRASLAADIAALGVRAGDTVMVHAAMRRVGPLLNGPDALSHGLLDVVGPDGTMMVYAGWESPHFDLLDDEGRMPNAWRDHVPGFDPAASRAVRLNGVIAEFVRTMPGAHRSGNPGASMAAIGGKAAWITADHPQDYGYGPGSPLAKLVELGGRVLMVGAPWDRLTLVHHADHLARIPGKRLVRVEVPFASPGGAIWRFIEEFDTDEPVHPALPDDYIERIVTAFVAQGNGTQGRIGDAPSLLVEAAAVVAFAADWVEQWVGRADG